VGPKAGEFYQDFCAHKATALKADGNDIEGVELVLRILCINQIGQMLCLHGSRSELICPFEGVQFSDRNAERRCKKNDETEQKTLPNAAGSVDQHPDADRPVRFGRTLGDPVVERPNGSPHRLMLTAARYSVDIEM
jgi:hypothetical protein